MEILGFLNKNISYELLAIIVFGGIFLTKYTKNITVINYPGAEPRSIRSQKA